MPNRLLVALLCAAAIVFACGPWNRSPSMATAAQAHVRTRTDSAVTSAFEMRVKQHGTAKQVDFVLHVTNTGRKQIELRFPTGQTHEFIVTDTAGKEVWRWSKGRMFTSALQNKLVKSKDTATYEDSWDAKVNRGTFVAVARLTSNNHPVEEHITFTLQ